MNTLADNPELMELESKLAAEADAFDAGNDASAKPEADEPAKEGNRTPDASQDGTKTGSTDAAKADVQKNETDKSKEGAASKEIGSEAGNKDGEKEQAQETRFAKAKKDSERLDRSWKALNDEKDAFRAEQEKVRKEREAWEAERRKAQETTQKTPPQNKVDPTLSKYSPEELEDAALEFSAEGKTEEAKRCFDVARALRAQDQKAKSDQDEATTKKAFWENAGRHVGQFPELNDIANGIGLHTKAILDGNAQYEKPHYGQEVARLLARSPHGFELAHQIARLREQASKSVSLEKRLTELESENKQLREATSLKSAPPSGDPSKAKDFNAMSIDEQEKALEAAMSDKGADEMFGGAG